MALNKDKQRMIEIGPDDMWTSFLEQVNDYLHEEKAIRHENDHIKSSEICQRIVSHIIICVFLFNNFWLTIDLICI
jgi:hypothetical protein